MAKKVLANSPYIYVWAAKEFKQKAAKIVGETILTFKGEPESGWVEIEKLPVDKDGVGIGWSGYPLTAAKWFMAVVNPQDYHDIPLPPVTPPGDEPVSIGDITAAEALTFVKVLRHIFGG